MKTILAMLVLTVSVGAIAQVEITKVLDKKEVSIDSDHAVIVRTSQTPDKVTLIMQVPMASSVCEDPRTEYIPRMCHRTEQVYRTQEVCRNVTTTTNNPGPTNPRGPRYNGTATSTGTTTTTRRVCTQERIYVGTRSIAYDCSYYNNYCARWGTNVNTESDKVKIKFKDLPALGGSEQETFRIAAKQRTKDGENVIYNISVLSTVEGREYEVESKGILGFDSYVIKSK